VSGVTYIHNIATLVDGRLGSQPQLRTSLVIENGVITGIGEEPNRADLVIDANELTVMPGLIDGHVHPSFGEWTPAQDSIGWIGNYVHGGNTTMVSAGELHLPGLPLDSLDPETVVSLAIASRASTTRARLSGAKLEAGTVLLVPGMSENDFDRMASVGIRYAKFIFYDWSRGFAEAQQYVRWAHDRNMVVKIHSGGVSRSGSSRTTGYEVIAAVEPDIVGHISGGPIPMPDNEIIQTIETLPEIYIEVCSSMNYRSTTVTVDALRRIDRLDRLTLGTDTPGGTGVIPRGMLRNICFLAGICGLDPLVAIAAATGNVAAAHRLGSGVIDVGRPADLVILGPIEGSSGGDALECFKIGDLPGISAVLIDGTLVVSPRSRQTPPPKRLITTSREGH
jgi:enamidase